MKKILSFFGLGDVSAPQTISAEKITFYKTVFAVLVECGYLSKEGTDTEWSQEKKNAIELEKMLKVELPKIFDVSEEFTLNLMRDYKNLVENLSSVSADDLIVISQLITEYKGDRERFLDKFEITLTKIDA